MAVQQIVRKLVVGAGVAYATDQISQWLGRTFETLAFLKSYPSRVSNGLVSGGLASWFFDEEKAREILNDYYLSSCKTISSSAKVLSVYLTCTATAVALSSFKVIPIKTSEIITLAKLGAIAGISYKIYLFFSLPDQENGLHSTKNETTQTPEISHQQALQDRINRGFEIIQRQLTMNSNEIYQSIVPKNVSSSIFQMPKLSIELRINQMTFRGHLFRNQVQSLAVFPLLINHQPCILSITQQRGIVLKVEFWKRNIEEEEERLDKPKSRFKTLCSPVKDHPTVEQKSEKISVDIQDHINAKFSLLEKQMQNNLRSSATLIQGIIQKPTRNPM